MILPLCNCSAKKIFYNVCEVDKLPIFKYEGIVRHIQPSKQLIGNSLNSFRDSLLSVYLEDNIKCPNYCEGIFQYTLQLFVNKQGFICEIMFIEDNNDSEILQNQIKQALKRIKLKPALKNKKKVDINIIVNVLVDLYNYPSNFRKKIFGESR